jgi:hypothetical protein
MCIYFLIEALLRRGLVAHRGNNVDHRTNVGHGINADHGINVDQHSKPQNKFKYSILYLHLFRGFECWST